MYVNGRYILVPLIHDYMYVNGRYILVPLIHDYMYVNGRYILVPLSLYMYVNIPLYVC